jgi:hypothetical protein
LQTIIALAKEVMDMAKVSYKEMISSRSLEDFASFGTVDSEEHKERLAEAN